MRSLSLGLDLGGGFSELLKKSVASPGRAENHTVVAARMQAASYGNHRRYVCFSPLWAEFPGLWARGVAESRGG